MESMSTQPHKRNMKINAQLPLCLIETDILPRVSAKTIGRCMCVCKQWKSLLSTPTFTTTHLRHVTINDYKLLQLKGKPPVTFRTVDGSTTKRSNPNPDHNTVEFIIASLDGLVCLASRKPTKFAFWNPLTGAYKKLSTRKRYHFWVDCGFTYSAFGFYKDQSNDYKLLCSIMGGVAGTYIYSHKLDSWKRIMSPVNIHLTSKWSRATLWCHCLYFIVTYKDRKIIICFNVKTETFREIQFPIGYARDNCGILVVFNGCIHLCASHTRSKWLKDGGMWRMDGDDRWVKVAFSESLYNESRRQHVYPGYVFGENKCFLEKMNMKDYIRNWCRLCSPSWDYTPGPSRRIMYVETLVSPNT